MLRRRLPAIWRAGAILGGAALLASCGVFSPHEAKVSAPACAPAKKVPASPQATGKHALATVNALKPPAGGKFRSCIAPIAKNSAIRGRMGKTLHTGCPVGISGLRYVQVSFIGFDGKPHTGELIVAKKHAKDIAGVFKKLYKAKYPIQEMRIADTADTRNKRSSLANNTVAFNCRKVTGGGSWSRHAHGAAIDVNPFINPYKKGDKIIPPAAGTYLKRSQVRPGMIRPNDVVVKAFAAIGWEWGGNYNSLKDYMHFSESGG